MPEDALLRGRNANRTHEMNSSLTRRRNGRGQEKWVTKQETILEVCAEQESGIVGIRAFQTEIGNFTGIEEATNRVRTAREMMRHAGR